MAIFMQGSSFINRPEHTISSYLTSGRTLCTQVESAQICGAAQQELKKNGKIRIKQTSNMATYSVQKSKGI